jgi:hypothetical protein
MQVPNWEVFPTELQAALIQAYPGIAWRAALYADEGDRAADGPAGVVVWARRRGAEVEVRVSTALIAHEYLPDLLQDIYAEAETRLSAGPPL